VTSIRDLYAGPYRLLNLLAAGHSTEIWEAIHDATRQRVAIKRLRAENPKRADVSLLRHEYAVGKALDHPRIVKALQIDQSRRGWFLVLELFPVSNMKQWIYQGVERIAHLVPKMIHQSSEAFLYLSEKGWVHGDVKPDNFLISPEGQVKIIDFALAQKRKTGLARLFAGRGKIQGTPSYMSPEQIRGKVLDHKADIYGFGCTLYELVSGKKPFTAPRPNELLAKHLRGAPPWLETANHNITPEFAALVRDMLAKKPADRPDIERFQLEFSNLQVFKVQPQPLGEDP